MQDEEKLLTVAEFAVLANISKQRVYQLLNNRLNDYVVTKNGIKMIRGSGIETVKQARVKQGFNKSSQGAIQDLNAELGTLKAQNAELQAQLEKRSQTRAIQELIQESSQGLNKSIQESSKESIQDLNAELEMLKAQNAELQAQLEKRSQTSAIQELIQESSQGLNKSIQESSKESIQDLNAELEMLKAQNAELQAQLEKRSQTRAIQELIQESSQGLNKSIQESSKESIQDLNAELEMLKAQNAELQAQLEKRSQTSAIQELTIERITAECERTRQHEEQAREKLESVLREVAAAAEARKRADAAEHQCTVKDKQIEALTAALQSAQQQAAELTAALATSQALQAGQIRLAMLDSDSSGKHVENQTEMTKAAVERSNCTQTNGKKYNFLTRLFRRRKK